MYLKGCPPDWWYEPDEDPYEPLWDTFCNWMNDAVVTEIFKEECGDDITEDEITALIEWHEDDAFCDITNKIDEESSDWDLFINFIYKIATPDNLKEYREYIKENEE